MRPESYAIVGTSGSGKSTLVNLLMGSSNDYQGSIRFDQRELRSIATESLYGLVSVVQQNVFIFDDTIRNNITMFRHFDEMLVQQATEKAGLTPLLAERGEDYICGEGGSGLSRRRAAAHLYRALPAAADARPAHRRGHGSAGRRHGLFRQRRHSGH